MKYSFHRKLNFFCTLFLFVFSNLASADITIQANQNAANFVASQGSAKVYLVGGKWGYGSFMDPTIPGAELVINNVSIVKFGKDEVGVVDVRPGNYNFTWKDINNEGKAEILSKQLSAGEILILRADFKMGGASLFLGPLAASATNKISEVSDRSSIKNKRLVIASNCPEVICGGKNDLVNAEKTLNTNSTQTKAEVVSPQANKQTAETPTQQITSPNIEALETKCRQLGFTVGTEKFGDCVMRLMK
jgi:hypothetical protein